MTAVTRKRSTVVPAAGPSRNLVVGVVVLVAIALIAGYLASRLATPGPSPVSVTGELSGVVSKVNAGRTNICLTVSGNPEAVCSGLWLPDGVAFPSVGSRISVWVVRVPTAQGAQDMFVLEPTTPADI